MDTKFGDISILCNSVDGLKHSQLGNGSKSYNTKGGIYWLLFINCNVNYIVIIKDEPLDDKLRCNERILKKRVFDKTRYWH